MRTSTVAILLAASLSACSNGSSSGHTTFSTGVDIPAIPSIPGRDFTARSEACIDPFFMVDDYQAKLAEEIHTGDANCVKKALSMGASAKQKIDTDIIPHGRTFEWPILYALQDSPLFFAQGAAVLKVLIENGADLNVQNDKGQTPLQAALTADTLDKYSWASAYLASTGNANLEVLDGAGNTPLLDVLSRQKKEAAQMLIGAGANIQANTRQGLTAFELAIADGYEELTVDLLNRGVDPNRVVIDGNTALHRAAQMKMPTLGHALLAKGTLPLNKPNNQGETALLIAVRQNQTDLAKEMMAKGANVDLASPNGGPLHEALRQNNSVLIQALVPAVSDINARDGQQSSPLILATRFGSSHNVQAIIGRGANFNLQDNTKMSALMYALQNKKADLTNALVTGSQVNLRGPEGRTALFYATSLGDIDSLAAHGADFNAKSDSGQTALSQTVKQGASDLALNLIRHGADTQWRDPQTNQTLLHIAIARNSLDVARTLLDGGQNANVTDSTGSTPLFLAITVPAIELLSQYHVDINHRNLQQRTALIGLAEFYLDFNERLDVVRRLVDLGADINAKNERGQTVLLLAVSPRGRRHTSTEIVSLIDYLLSHRAAVDATDLSGNTALHITTSDAIVRQLLAMHASTAVRNHNHLKAAEVQTARKLDIDGQIAIETRQLAKLEADLRAAPSGSQLALVLQRQEDASRARIDAWTASSEEFQRIVDLLSGQN